MQIHELNNFTGTLGSGAYLAIDDGNDTGKISSQGLLAATEARIDNIIAGPAPSAEEIVDARLGADGVTYPSLGDAIRDQFTDVKSELNNLFRTSSVYAEQGGLDSNGLPYDSSKRIRTSFFQIPSAGYRITVSSEYYFNIATYNEDLSLRSWTYNNWQSTIVINNTSRYFKLVITRVDDKAINPTEAYNAFTVGMSDCKHYLPLSMVANRLVELDKTDAEEDFISRFSLNDNLVGLTDMNWEYQNWTFPLAISYNRIRNKLYFTFTNASAYSGIAEYDFDTQQVTKTFLKKNTEADDHNLIAVLMMSNHHLLCAYSDGHSTGRNMFVRISESEECIEKFSEPIVLPSIRLTCYAQLFEYDEKIYLFYRINDIAWAYRISSDFGKTWSSEVMLIKSDVQYYCQFAETTTDGVLRVCCYSNPSENDTNIRMAYLHLDNMTLYDTDNTTVLGSNTVLSSALSIIIPVASGKKNRLYNAARTAIGDVKVLYCEFSTSVEDDGVYYVYDNGATVEVADAGYALWVPKAQLGVAWIETEQIVVAKGVQGRDVIEIYDYSNGIVSFNRTVADNARGSIGIRTARPVVDNNNKAILYLKGYFNPDSFKDATMDGNIYLLT